MGKIPHKISYPYIEICVYFIHTHTFHDSFCHLARTVKQSVSAQLIFERHLDCETVYRADALEKHDQCGSHCIGSEITCYCTIEIEAIFKDLFTVCAHSLSYFIGTFNPINSSRQNGAFIRHQTWPSLVQVIVKQAPRHFLNHCQRNVNCTLGNKF